MGVTTPQGKAGRQPKGEGWEKEDGTKSDARSASSGGGHVSVSRSSRGSPMEYSGQDSPGTHGLLVQRYLFASTMEYSGQDSPGTHRQKYLFAGTKVLVCWYTRTDTDAAFRQGACSDSLSLPLSACVSFGLKQTPFFFSAASEAGDAGAATPREWEEREREEGNFALLCRAAFEFAATR